MGRPARLLKQRPVPQRTRHIVENFGVELLPTEPRPFVLANYLLQKRRRQIGPIVVCRAARHDRRGVGEQLADDLNWLWRGGDDDARVIPQAQPEH